MGNAGLALSMKVYGPGRWDLVLGAGFASGQDAGRGGGPGGWQGGGPGGWQDLSVLYLVLSMPRAYSWMVARSRHKRESGFRPLLTPLSFRIRLTPCFEDTAVMNEYLRSR